MSIGAKIMSFRYKRHQGKEEIILNVMPPLNIMGEGGGINQQAVRDGNNQIYFSILADNINVFYNDE